MFSLCGKTSMFRKVVDKKSLPSRVDIAVVGSGPNGLSAAHRLNAAFPQLSHIVLEKSDTVAGNIFRYPNVRWHSNFSSLRLHSAINKLIPSSFRPTSREFGRYLQLFALEHQLEVHTGVELHAMGHTYPPETGGTVLHLKTSAGITTLRASIVVLATGIYDNPIGLPGIERNLYASRLDPRLRGETCVVVGSGASAVDAIIYLLPRNRVYWVRRTSQLPSIWPELVPRFQKTVTKFRHNLQTICPADVDRIGSKEVVLSSGRSLMDVDRVIALTGYRVTGPLTSALNLRSENGALVLSKHLETDIPGVFVFGSMAARYNNASQKIEQTFAKNGNQRKFDAIHARITHYYSNGYLQ